MVLCPNFLPGPRTATPACRFCKWHPLFSGEDHEGLARLDGGAVLWTNLASLPAGTL